MNEKVIEPSRQKAKETLKKRKGKGFYAEIGKLGADKRWKREKLEKINKKELNKEMK